MGKKAARFAPLPNYKPITNPRAARAATSAFHQGSGLLRSRYQTASAVATSTSKVSSKFCFRCITQLGRRPQRGEAPLSTLEVGAINLQLSSCAFLKVDAVDLNSRNPLIREVDFMDVPAKGSYDAVTLFMVLNCVPDAASRGKMLAHANAHLRSDGLLFLAIPLRLVKGDLLQKFMSVFMPKLGFDLLQSETTPKIALMCFKKVAGAESSSARTFKGADGFDVQLAE